MSAWLRSVSTGHASMSSSATNAACRRTIPAAIIIWRKPRCSIACRSRRATCCACAARTLPKRPRRATPRNFARDLGDDGRIDLVLLGLGDNGHTASLFPGLAVVTETSRTVMACYVEVVGMWRLTLTPPPINAARRVAFLVAGDSKAEVLRQVLQGPRKPIELPAQSHTTIRTARRLADRRSGRGEAGASSVKGPTPAAVRSCAAGIWRMCRRRPPAR